MTHFGQCPVCHTQIPQERLFADSIVCECGWTASKKSLEMEEKNVRSSIVIIVTIASLLIGSFIHAINWDTHFVDVIPLKLAVWSGTASIHDMRALSEICAERLKHDCVEEMYQDMFSHDPQNIEVLAELGMLQSKRGKFPQAVTTFQTYFSRNGQNLEAAYNYAKALAHSGQIDEAIHYFDFVLKAKPDVLQITVTRAYVTTLIQYNRLQEAKSLIQTLRKKGTNTGMFMDKELKTIDARLSSTQARNS